MNLIRMFTFKQIMVNIALILQRRRIEEQNRKKRSQLGIFQPNEDSRPNSGGRDRRKRADEKSPLMPNSKPSTPTPYGNDNSFIS